MRPSKKQVLICLAIAVVLSLFVGPPPDQLGPEMDSIIPFMIGKILGFFIFCMIPVMIANAIARRKEKPKTEKV